MAKIFIGVAWPYANGVIHIGGVAGCYLPPDIFARFQRMKGNEVLMVSGSDSHGTPTTICAEAEGVSPEEIAERYHKINWDYLQKLGSSYSLFLNTENSTHKEVAQDFFRRLYDEGYIYEKEMVLPYCESCGRFLPDRYVEGTCPHCEYESARGDNCDECGKLLDPEDLISPRCKNCSTEPIMKRRNHLFFKLSAFEEPLKEYVKDKDYWRAPVIKFTRSWLEGGLEDRPVSRDIAWGIDIPIEGHEDKKIYVWFEAFMGYYSMAVEWARLQGEPDKWKEFWQDPDVRHYYFLGKDNILFHTIFWPAVLLGDGTLNLPYDVPANQFMRFAGEKFSKSTGVSLGIDYFLDNYPVDSLRYYLAINMPENRDVDFSWDDFVAKNNGELLATYGNFVHRVLTFTGKNYGEFPQPGELEEIDKKALEMIENRWKVVGDHLEVCQFKAALKKVMELAKFGNQYMDTKAPWSQIREDREACATTLYVCLRIVQSLCTMASPFLPHSSQRLWEMLGNEGEVEKHGWDYALEDIPVGRKLVKPTPLFEKLESPETAGIEDETERLDIRVAKVLSATDHPDAEKLIVMEIDIGTEKRTIVAGLKPYYTREDLEGKNIIVLCNLQPAKLRGIESNGMLLAAEDGEVVSLLIDESGAKAGERVLGIEDAPVITFEDFKKLRIVAGLATEKGVQVGKEDFVELEAPSGSHIILFFGEGELGFLPFKAGETFVSLDQDVSPGSRVS
ncbi:MAG: methionine--tRNA ligase [Methanobacteriota archaeon]|nr:MAG: methionine--tRNA ligase [Euryarchaeota archaeon]